MTPPSERRSWRLALLAALAVVAPGLALGCGHTVRTRYAELITPAAACRAEAPGPLSPEAMRADFAVLERVLRRGYAGYPLAAEEAEWERVFAEGRARLPDAPRSALAFRDLLAEHFRFLDDNHVGFWVYVDGERRWRGTSGHDQAYVAALRLEEEGGAHRAPDGATLVGCEGVESAELVRPVLGPGAAVELRPLVLSREPLEALRCTFEAGGEEEVRALPVRRVDLGAERSAPLRVEEAPFPWIRLRTLVMSQEPVLEEFVATAERVREAPVVVLDLRRTGGGSDRFVNRWFAQLTSQDLRYWVRGRLESEVVLQGALSFWECVRVARPTNGDSWVDRRIARAHRELAEAREERGLFYELEPKPTRVFGRAPRRFGGRLLVVVDRGCQSACETAILLARQVEGAVIVGENTGGVMKVGEMRRYRLPRSQIHLTLGHQSHTDPFGAFREGRGFVPDVWLDGEDPEGDVRAVAECLARDDCPLRFR